MVNLVVLMLHEADYWFHNLCVGEETFCTLVFKVSSLKKIIDNLDYKRTVSGGDHNASKMYLLIYRSYSHQM